MVSDIAMLPMFIICHCMHYDEHCMITIFSVCPPVGVVREKVAWLEVVNCRAPPT